MGRKFIFAFVFTLLCGFAFAKENLAILPFTGGQGNEGETIAELFSFEPRLGEVFSLIPRTSVSRAVARERGFQMASGMTDPDTVVSIANEVGARYVVAGSITSVGNNNLLVISILDIRNLQQIAGDFQTYPRGRIEDLRRRLPSMAENIIRATLRNTASLPKLAIVPVQLQGDMDWRVADTLAQLLAIHLIRSGKYAVFPRTGSLEQVQAEHDAQMRGYTADRNIVGIGHGENPDYVLSVVARKLGSVNMFNAVIINLLTRVQDVGRSVDYQDINDGMRAMETMSVALTSTTEQIAQRQQEEDKLQDELRKEREREAFWNEKSSLATRNTYEFLSGYFQWGGDDKRGDDITGFGGSIFPITGFHFSPMPYFNLGLETRIGGSHRYYYENGYSYNYYANGYSYDSYVSGYFDDSYYFYISWSPMLGLIFPINENVKLFGDVMLELGYLGGIGWGKFTDWITPAFDIGILFLWGYDFFPGIEIKYRGTWSADSYVHSIGVGLLFSAWDWD